MQTLKQLTKRFWGDWTNRHIVFVVIFSCIGGAVIGLLQRLGMKIAMMDGAMVALAIAIVLSYIVNPPRNESR